jgi:hypothetical protein
MKKFLIIAVMLMSACGSLTAPARTMTPTLSKDGDVTCRSGYHIAYRSGEWVCEVDE